MHALSAPPVLLWLQAQLPGLPPPSQPDTLRAQLSSLSLSFAAVRSGDAALLEQQLLYSELCELSRMHLGHGQLQAHSCRLSPRLTAAAVAYRVGCSLIPDSIQYCPGIELLREGECMDVDDPAQWLVPWLDDQHRVCTLMPHLVCAWTPSGAFLVCVFA